MVMERRNDGHPLLLALSIILLITQQPCQQPSQLSTISLHNASPWKDTISMKEGFSSGSHQGLPVLLLLGKWKERFKLS